MLPSGLWITSAGRIYGTPTAAGVFPINARVTDSIGNSYQAAITLRIGGSSLSLATSSLAGASSGLPYSQTIAAVGGTGPFTFAVGTRNFARRPDDCRYRTDLGHANHYGHF